MKKKYFKNSIISFVLIISTILMPLSFVPKKVKAQSITGYASGLAPIIAKLPQCTEVVGSGINSLFSGIGDIFSSGNSPIPMTEITLPSASDMMGDITAVTDQELLEGTAQAFTKGFDSVDVNISDTKEGKAILDTYRNSIATKKAVESINTNSTCIQSIGRLIIKMLLQKLTVSTVAWINSGFDGNPAFVQDPGKFFNDIAKNEILQFGLEINNPELFPFGKIWMQNTAEAFNSKFQDNARYSLNELIRETNPEYSALTFQQDFSQGGWNAWTAMTQAPQNNPLGFKLMADNEIQRRLAGTTQSTAQNVRDALQQANGFLGDQRCVDPMGLTREQHNAALKAGRKIIDNGIEIIAGACQRWEYVTPGKLISEAATTAINYQSDAYLDVEDLNDAVAAILDALLGQFSSNLMEKGFANLGDQGADGTLIYDSSIGSEPYMSQAEKDFMPAQLTSSWLSANPNFNIRTDLTQALIDEQRTYSDKLQLQNKELMSTTDGKKYTIDSANAYGLIPTIYQLDYCIPGPHPGWEEDSRRILSGMENLIIPETIASLEDRDMATIVGAVSSFAPLAGAVAGAAIGSAVPIVGTIIGAAVGWAVSFVVNLFSSDDSENVRVYYSAQIAALTGYLPDYGNDNDARVGNISSKQGAVQVIDTVFYRYVEIMNKTYFSSPEILPTVAKEAATNFDQVAGYTQMIKNNEDKISSLKTTINILGEIKNKINLLNAEYKNPNGQFKSGKTEENYENALKPQINAFGRLSASMVNGNDIASTDNLLKQIIDKKDYIYNNLLKGDYGCEADLAKTQKQFTSAVGTAYPGGEYDWGNYNATSVTRMTYPFPILYDYAPGTSGFGPGFLNFVVFSSENGGGSKGTNRRGGERLHIHDMVPQRENPDMREKSVGHFESIIGVY